MNTMPMDNLTERMNSPTRTQRESETLGGAFAGTKLRLFLHSPEKPQRVHGYLVVSGKSRILYILTTTRSQVSAKSLPLLTNAAQDVIKQSECTNRPWLGTRWSLKRHCELPIARVSLGSCRDGSVSVYSSRVTPPVSVAILHATCPEPVPGVRDAACPVPVAKPLNLPPDLPDPTLSASATPSAFWDQLWVIVAALLEHQSGSFSGVEDAAHPAAVPVPGIVDAARHVARSVPVAAPPDPPVPVPGVEEVTP
ncbi:hypothetical protein P4O66_006575 [Electrophorus voltai]|uniref:Uncharacterized protein n=1 Tax=Electrophorus voltai TaxID=2609070 RepID=A0AAD8ZL53_9TELE|nr:hypothetical protein P4O66_006575 [Electrophorus voltai]